MGKPSLLLCMGAPWLWVGLLVALIDALLFSYGSAQLATLSLRHITSFSAAVLAGCCALALWPKPGLGVDKQRPMVFVLLAVLALVLHGGILASLMQILALPAWLAIAIASITASLALFYGYASYLHLQRADVSEETRWICLCAAAVGYTLALKLAYLGLPELIFEESYYWNYAQHLDIGYLDHPLIIAWTIKAFTSLLGNGEFGVRFGAFLYWFVTAYFTFRLTRELFDKATAYAVLLLVALLPAYFSFGWFMSPDAPLTAAWAAAVYFAHRVLILQDRKAWIGLGIALGLGMSSKYTIALLGAALVLFMLADRKNRAWLAKPEPYIALLIILALFSPVVIWNLQHDWISFTFQSQARLASKHAFSLPRFISNLIIFLTPTGILAVLAILACRKPLLAQMGTGSAAASPQRSYLLLAWLALFPVAVFAFLSLFRASKLNWTGPCWLALLPLIACMMTMKIEAATPRLMAWSQRAWPATLGILLLGYGIAFHYLSLGFPRVPYPQNVHLMGWRDFGHDMEELLNKMEKETGEHILLVGMDRNRIASGLAYYRTRAIENSHAAITHASAFDTSSVHLFAGNGLMYELWFPVEQQAHKTMLLVSDNPDDLNSAEVLSRTQPAGDIQSIEIRKNGGRAGRYYYRLVKDYRVKSSSSAKAGSSADE